MTTSSITNDTSSGPKHVSASGASGRRRTKNNDSSSQKKNKPPQRGMGVAQLELEIRRDQQLERLRLEERWKKMTEIAPLPPPPPPPPPFNNTFAAPQLNGAFQFRQPAVNYFNGVVGDQPHHHHHVYQNMMTSELSSIQNNSFVKCVSDGCGVCYKKKRINGGGSSTCSVNQYRNYAANNNAFVETIDAGRPRRIQVREVKEVMPVQRNGMNLMTEYEFFPGEMMRTASSAWSVNGLGGGVSGGGTSVDGTMLGLRAGDGSCVTAITGNEEGCVSSLDLTLKLSY